MHGETVKFEKKSLRYDARSEKHQSIGEGHFVPVFNFGPCHESLQGSDDTTMGSYKRRPL